jgi:formamidopyrimidine-DNA glycosylase
MPELAEVEFLRKRWNPGIGEKIKHVALHDKARVFRGVDTAQLAHALNSAALKSSEAAAKQMLFRFSGDIWLGIHLGMTGELKCAAVPYSPEKHDHLVILTTSHALIFEDPRMFGRVQFSQGKEMPKWWSSIAPAILSDEFTVQAVADFLKRRKKAPIKAVLLMQERFPGIGNWMADEILWRAEIHPKRAAGSLNEAEIKALHRECRWVVREALRIIGENFGDLPDSWLFPHRWQKGGTCPATGAPLMHAEIGGRTTCWSPGRQRLPGEKAPEAAEPNGAKGRKSAAKTTSAKGASSERNATRPKTRRGGARSRWHKTIRAKSIHGRR